MPGIVKKTSQAKPVVPAIVKEQPKPVIIEPKPEIIPDEKAKKPKNVQKSKCATCNKETGCEREDDYNTLEGCEDYEKRKKERPAVYIPPPPEPPKELKSPSQYETEYYQQYHLNSTLNEKELKLILKDRNDIPKNVVHFLIRIKRERAFVDEYYDIAKKDIEKK